MNNNLYDAAERRAHKGFGSICTITSGEGCV